MGRFQGVRDMWIVKKTQRASWDFFFFLAMPSGMWDLIHSSLTGDGTHPPCSRSGGVFTPGQGGPWNVSGEEGA